MGPLSKRASSTICGLASQLCRGQIAPALSGDCPVLGKASGSILPDFDRRRSSSAPPLPPKTVDGKVLHPDLMNKNFVKAQYAVRGELYLKAEQLEKAGKEIIYTNGTILLTITDLICFLFATLWCIKNIFLCVKILVACAALAVVYVSV